SLTRPTQIRLLDLYTLTRSKLPGSEGLWRPRWSPDGRFVIALSSDSSALMICEYPRGKWRRLGRDLGTIGTPVWSHDSRYVYFDAVAPHDFKYMRVRVSDGKAEQIVSIKNVGRYRGIWGLWSGLAPGDIPLFTQDTSRHDVYAFNLRLP